MTRRPPDENDPDSSPQNEEMNEVQVLTHRRGLLSLVFESELAYNRGLNIKNCEEYEGIKTKFKDVDLTKYPHRLHNLCMDDQCLHLMKEALLRLRPDGYVFTSESGLYGDLSQVYDHIGQQIKKMEDLPSLPKPRDRSMEHLHLAMNICRALRHTRRTYNSLSDMQAIARAAEAMKTILAEANGCGTDLIWAIIYRPEICPDLLNTLKTANMSDFLTTKVTSEAGILDCTGLGQLISRRSEDSERMKYQIPLLDDADFTGMHVLAALVKVVLTQFWLSEGWVTDVAAYDFTMPQSILTNAVNENEIDDDRFRIDT